MFIVLNDIEKFCEFRKQSLLYVLFDSVQNTRGNLFVIGTTQCTNIIERFEKRILSRFSQRIVYTFSLGSFKEYLDVLLEILDCPENEKWNRNVQTALSNKVKSMFQQFYDIDNSIGRLFQIIVIILNSIQDSINESHFILPLSNALHSSRIKYLNDFSDTEILILLLISQHCRNQGSETFFKKFLIDCVNKFYEHHNTIQVTSERVELAFTELVKSRVIQPSSARISKKNTGLYTMMYHEEEIKEMLRNKVNMPECINLLVKHDFLH
uniref:Origin recognition complex subunit 4 n=1 Tax=Myxobolus squamalis TaxID=59785 RepID=A0A6B2G4Q4_MYXSQ